MFLSIPVIAVILVSFLLIVTFFFKLRKTENLINSFFAGLVFMVLSGGGIAAWNLNGLPRIFKNPFAGSKTAASTPQNSEPGSSKTPSTNSKTQENNGNNGNSGNNGNNGSFLLLGNPSLAEPAGKPDNQLLTNSVFALSYNRKLGMANWVVWTLTKNDFGEADRQNDFRPDDRLDPKKQILPTDYSNSGYDRGHLCPSADRTSGTEANSATFVMSNMAPQTHDLNAGPWEKLEKFTRALARRNQTVVIYAGGWGSLGKLKGKNQEINIPSHFWKIVVVLNNFDPSAKTIPPATRIISVWMPNQKGIADRNWRDYKTCVKDIEAKTGLTFFRGFSCPPEVKTKIDREPGTD